MRLRLLFLLSTVLFCNFLISQSVFKIDESVSREKSQEFVKRALHYNIDIKQLEEKTKDSRSSVELEIKTLDGDKTLLLDRFQLLSGSYELFTENGAQRSAARSYEFYKGKVKGAKNSNVGMSIIGSEIHLLIHDENGSYEVKKTGKETKTYAGFYTQDIYDKKYIPCETDTGIEIGKKEDDKTTVTRSGQLDCVEVYLEVDYKAHTKNGSVLANTETWALAILAQVAIFFHDAGSPISISGVKVYTTNESDPYKVESNTAEALSAFRDSMNNQGFNGRLAHLLSGRGLGGGRASLSVLCSNFSNQAVSGNLTSGGTTYGTYTWNINVIAHELGHNFGSQHTHDCVWNGNGTQIDDCGNVWATNNGYGTGSCYDEDNKILPGSNNATIMSYCHVASGASINLNLGFHPQVRERMYDRFASSTCGGSEACVGVPPLNDNCHRAEVLIPTIACAVRTYDNIYATDSGLSPGISCGSGGVKDVWFKVLIPSNGKLTLETRQISGGIADMVMQVYTGDCLNLSSSSCDDDSGSGAHAKIDIDDINLADQEVLLRLVSKTDSEGEFGICVFSADLPCSDTAADLLDFYEATNGDDWTNKTGWEDGAAGNDCNFCNWFGIICDIDERVISISLNNNNLLGNLGTTLNTLGEIESLSLSGNGLTGNIASNFLDVTNLKYLNLSGNALQGSIPDEIIQGPLLEGAQFANNNLSGDLPVLTYSTKITYLDLANNNFSGCYPRVYTRFLSNGEVSLNGNLLLPYGGDFYDRPSAYAGFDFDSDSHCFEISDCVDFDNTIYDGAPELCDGKDNDCDEDVDEGLDSGPNQWIGSLTDSIWSDESNWSMGHLPEACEDVEIGMANEVVTIAYTGTQNSIYQNLKSICLGPNAMLDMDRKFNLIIKNGYVLNMGTMNLEGYVEMRDLDPAKDAIENFGTLNFKSNSYFYISKGGRYTINNKGGGVMNNHGTIFIDSGNSITGMSALRNESILNNSGLIEIVGDFMGPEILLLSSSEINSSGEIKVGGEGQGEGGG